ncbi:zinc finger, CCHC-type containing protein, partial [Tanacetum coccineum]
ASNWLECLPAGSITTWEDLTTRFLTQFFPPERTAKLRNDILIFQQHHGESLFEAWTRPSPQSQALEPLLKIEYETTWQRTPKEWKDLRTPFSSNAMGSIVG